MLAEFGGRGPFFDILLKANLLKSLAIVNREHAEQGKHTAVTAGAPRTGSPYWNPFNIFTTITTSLYGWRISVRGR